MQYRKLGKSSLAISAIGFGCMSLKNGEKDNIRLLHTALDNGINYFDTADIYDQGANESIVGNAFQRKRDQVILATKVGNVWRKEGNGFDWNPSKLHIVKSVEESLQRLKTDYIDLYQLHGGTLEDNIGETIEAFELLQTQGKIRFYGISSIRPNVIRTYVKCSKIVSLMVQYSLLDRRPEEGVLPLMEDNSIGVVVRGSLASGLLVSKPAKEYLGYSSQEIGQFQKTIQFLTNDHRDATAVALQYVLQNKAVTSTVVGFHTKEQLENALKALDAHSLTQEELLFLQTQIPAKLYEQHR